jgi:hypothetical protein
LPSSERRRTKDDRRPLRAYIGAGRARLGPGRSTLMLPDILLNDVIGVICLLVIGFVIAFLVHVINVAGQAADKVNKS